MALHKSYLLAWSRGAPTMLWLCFGFPSFFMFVCLFVSWVFVCLCCSIVVQGWGAWAEDEWTKIRVAGINMRTPKPCGRCSVPTINQRTLERRREPRATMEKFRWELKEPLCVRRLTFNVEPVHRRGVVTCTLTAVALCVTKCTNIFQIQIQIQIQILILILILILVLVSSWAAAAPS